MRGIGGACQRPAGLIVIVTFSLNLVNSASGESVETIKLNCFIASGMFVINTFEINFGQFKNLLLYSGLIDVKMAFTVRFFMQDAVCSIWTLTAKIDKILEITLEIWEIWDIYRRYFHLLLISEIYTTYVKDCVEWDRNMSQLQLTFNGGNRKIDNPYNNSAAG